MGLWFYLAVVNLLAFLLMGVDKGRAQHNQWRIPEKTLFLFPLLGGSLGGLLALMVFRHKTRHPPFAWGFPLLLCLQIAALWLVT